MGHIINPISQRLGLTKFWDSTWALSRASNYSFSYINTENVFLARFLKRIIIKFARRLFRKGNILLGFKLINIRSQLILCLEAKIKFLPILHKRVGQCLRIIQRNFLSIAGKKKYRLIQKRLFEKSQLERENWLTARSNTKPHRFKKQKAKSFISRNQRWASQSPNKSQSPRVPTVNNKNTYIKERLIVDQASLNRTLLKPYHEFYRDSRKAQVYVSSLNFVDLMAYNWMASTMNRRLYKLTSTVKNTHLFLIKKIISFLKSEFVRYIFINRWLATLKTFLYSILTRFYVKAPLLKIIFIAQSANVITAAFVAKYIAIRLIQRQPLRRLIFTVLRQMKRAVDSAWIYGFRLACNGRFERRGRATHIWKTVGKIPVSNVNISVDYSLMLPVLTNSICAVKVWLTSTQPTERLFIH